MSATTVCGVSVSCVYVGGGESLGLAGAGLAERAVPSAAKTNERRNSRPNADDRTSVSVDSGETAPSSRIDNGSRIQEA